MSRLSEWKVKAQAGCNPVLPSSAGRNIVIVMTENLQLNKVRSFLYSSQKPVLANSVIVTVSNVLVEWSCVSKT